MPYAIATLTKKHLQAFRVFILMASRRLKSDRFIAGQFDKETYTPEGLHWVQYTTMKDVLIR